MATITVIASEAKQSRDRDDCRSLASFGIACAMRGQALNPAYVTISGLLLKANA
jgi:hypothetical protein